MHIDYTKHNVGNTDHLIREGIGILLIASIFSGNSWAVGVIGAMLLVTGYFRFCPAYALMEFSTNKVVAPVGK